MFTIHTCPRQQCLLQVIITHCHIIIVNIHYSINCMRVLCRRPTFDFMAMFGKAIFDRSKAARFADSIDRTDSQVTVYSEAIYEKPFTSDPVSG